MTRILAAFLAVGVGMMCLVTLSGRAAAVPGTEGGASLGVSLFVGAATDDEAPSYAYVRSSKCKKCHIKEHKSWKKTKMAKAFETLKPGQAVEAKLKFKLDPQKDYTRDTACLKCHTTGFGHKGGYAIPDPSDKKQVKTAKKLQGVGCESCHGPGSEYIKVFTEIFKSKRKYNIEELYAVGLTKMDAGACTQCHNEEGPTHDPSKPFDFAAMKAQDAHENVPLKQRE